MIRQKIQDLRWRPVGLKIVWADGPRPERGWENGCEERCGSVSGWRVGGGVSTRRVKDTDPENGKTVGRVFKIRR